jgi:hypothetical protein
MSKIIKEELDRIKEIMGLITEATPQPITKILKSITDFLATDEGSVIFFSPDKNPYWKSVRGFGDKSSSQIKYYFQGLPETEKSNIINKFMTAAKGSKDEKYSTILNDLLTGVSKEIKVEIPTSSGTQRFTIKQDALIDNIKKSKNYDEWVKGLGLTGDELLNLNSFLSSLYRKFRGAKMTRTSEKFTQQLKALKSSFSVQPLNRLLGSMFKDSSTIISEIRQLSDDWDVAINELGDNPEKIKETTQVFALEISEKMNQLMAKGVKTYNGALDQLNLPTKIKTAIESNDNNALVSLGKSREEKNFLGQVKNVVTEFKNSIGNLFKRELNKETNKKQIKINFWDVGSYFFLGQKNIKARVYNTIIKNHMFGTSPFVFKGRTYKLPKFWAIIKTSMVMALSSSILLISYKFICVLLRTFYFSFGFERNINEKFKEYGFKPPFDGISDEYTGGEDIIEDVIGQFLQEFVKEFGNGESVKMVIPIIGPIFNSLAVSAWEIFKGKKVWGTEEELIQNLETRAGTTAEDKLTVQDSIRFTNNVLYRDERFSQIEKTNPEAIQTNQFTDNGVEYIIVQVNNGNDSKNYFFRKDNYLEVDSKTGEPISNQIKIPNPNDTGTQTTTKGAY